MRYNYQLPTISFILINADRPEAFREQTRHAPTFFPAPPVLWLPAIPGRESRVIIGVRLFTLMYFFLLSFSSAIFLPIWTILPTGYKHTVASVNVRDRLALICILLDQPALAEIALKKNNTTRTVPILLRTSSSQTWTAINLWSASGRDYFCWHVKTRYYCLSPLSTYIFLNFHYCKIVKKHSHFWFCTCWF